MRCARPANEHAQTAVPHSALPCPSGDVVGAGLCAEWCGPGGGHPARRYGRRSRRERETGTRGHGHHPWSPAGMPADAPSFRGQPDAGGICTAHGCTPSRPRIDLPHGPRRLPGTPFRTRPGHRFLWGNLCGAMVRCTRTPVTSCSAMRGSTGTAVAKGTAGPPHSGTRRNRHADLTPADSSAEVVAMDRDKAMDPSPLRIPTHRWQPCPCAWRNQSFRFPIPFPMP